MLVEGERIAAVGAAAELAAAHPGASRVDLPGCVLAPGFVNLHSHIEYAAYSGLGDGLAFGPWISAHTQRARRCSGARASTRWRGSAPPSACVRA